MRYIRSIVLLVMFAIICVMLFVAGQQAANASEQQEPNRATVVWEMGGWDGRPVWEPPQEFVAVEFTVGGDINSADHLIPECGFFQVDVYKYNNEANRAKVNNLIAGGVLYGPNNPPEPLIGGGHGTAWKFVNQGDCTTVTVTTTTMEPTTTTTTSTIPSSTSTTTVPETTSTVPPSSTTTTVTEETTTTTESLTTTTQPTTTTSESGTSMPPSTTQPKSSTTTPSECETGETNEDGECTLPYTGAPLALFAGLGLGLATLGGLALRAAREES